MKKLITSLVAGCSALLVAATLLAPVEVAAVVKNVQIMSDGKPLANTRVTLTSPSGKKDESDTDDNGVLIFDFDEDGDWNVSWPGGSMIVKAGGGIGPYIVVPAIVGISAAIIAAQDSDNDDKQQSSGNDLVFSLTVQAIVSNPDNHPQNFENCSYNVQVSGSSVTISCSGSGIDFTASGSIDSSGNFTASGGGNYQGFPTTFNIGGQIIETSGSWDGQIDSCNGGCPDTNGNTIEEPIVADFTGSVG